MIESNVASSFRDPSGFVFVRDNALYRQVNQSFQPDFDRLVESGLYGALLEQELIVPHEEVELALAAAPGAYKILRPEQIPFISYPYEWSFGQLKDAALATLSVQELALDHGMSLRDASVFNIQFRRGKPILIDTLSFERLPESIPWVAYRQFCQHFLAPLALMSYRDVRLGQLSRIHLDGVPLDLAAAVLPLRARLRASLLIHLFLHARSQRKHATTTDARKASKGRAFTPQAFSGLIQSLRGAVQKLRWEPDRSVWATYYSEAESYTPDALESKKALVGSLLQEAAPKSVWDLGANTGLFSRVAAEDGSNVVSFDLDPGAVELNYREVVSRNETNILPLVMDLTNPSPAIGWENQERASLAERGPVDLVMALALIHHLAIANNVPLERIAEFFGTLAPWLLVEFVPKGDPMVERLLATREDIFPDYTRQGFERSFGQRFAIVRRQPIAGSDRVLYLMRGR
ncbi:MAG TPA: class I SAM-dependent methyltransferase [Actinomycetota bacterium]